MSRLSEKYKIPEPVIKNMIDDGVIPCAWAAREEVWKLHNEGKSTAEIAFATNRTTRSVRYIIEAMRK